jgi:hypothetical protein
MLEPRTEQLQVGLDGGIEVGDRDPDVVRR